MTHWTHYRKQRRRAPAYPELMTPQQLERIALDYTSRILRGQGTEDDRVETKRELPMDIHHTARRLAGHANSAMGGDIVWIIGLDEKARRLVGLSSDPDPADWWAQMRSRFDGAAPQLEHQFTLEVESGAVLALSFQTEQFPYVVKAAGGGQISREIPWRTSTATGSAGKRDLLAMIGRRVAKPQVEFVTCAVSPTSSSAGNGVQISGELLFLPQDGPLPILFPRHRLSGILNVLVGGEEPAFLAEPLDVLWGEFVSRGPAVSHFSHMEHKYEQPFVWAQSDGIYVAGPGLLPFREHKALLPSFPSLPGLAFTVSFDLGAAGEEWTVHVASSLLRRTGPEDPAVFS